VKPNINLIDAHPSLNNNGHPMDGALVGVGSLWLLNELCFYPQH
jgi:hypothetical protein